VHRGFGNGKPVSAAELAGKSSVLVLPNGLAGRLDSRSTAVDNQVIAEYITTLIRSQKERCGSNFLGMTKSANRNAKGMQYF